jgi:hypothetical protein
MLPEPSTIQAQTDKPFILRNAQVNRECPKLLPITRTIRRGMIFHSCLGTPSNPSVTSLKSNGKAPKKSEAALHISTVAYLPGYSV